MSKIWKPQSIETLKYWIDTILDEASDELNDWETKFIEDMRIRVMFGNYVSETQEKKLESIYAEKTK